MAKTFQVVVTIQGFTDADAAKGVAKSLEQNVKPPGCTVSALVSEQKADGPVDDISEAPTPPAKPTSP
jgi:hypothetical protein